MRSSTILILVHASLIFLGIAAAPSAFSQTKSQPVFVSKIDDELSIKTVVVAPFTDNMSGIYARPLTDHLRDKLANDPQWTLVPFPMRPVKVEALEDRPEDAKRILKDANAEAMITGRFVKGPSGLALRLILFVGPTGFPLLLEESNEPERFDLDNLKLRLDEAVTKIREKMPYRGTLLSRRGQQVTLNLGKNEGLRDGSDVSVIQVLKVQRHPKKHFMITSDREILGKVRVFKADEELSFGNIIFEKEAGLLATGMKVLPDGVVRYSEPITTQEGRLVEDLANRSDQPVAFGEKPVEWLPEPPPQYGHVQVLAGAAQYTESATITATGPVEASNSLSPTLAVNVEGWLNADWYVGFDLRQSAFSMTHDIAGYQPTKLSVSLSKYDLAVGHNFLLSPDFLGPKIQVSGGLGKFSSRVTDTSPVLFSNMEYGGLFVGFTFTTPLGDDVPWELGAKLRYFLSPGISETVSSGDTKSVSASDFGFLVAKKVRRNFRYLGELSFEDYNSDFTPNGDRPASGISHKMTTLLLGLEYSF